MPDSAINRLELGVIGNCTLAALVDQQARINWCGFPHFDGDPGFCSLLEPHLEGGDWSFELEDFDRSEQHYLANTAILVTRLYDRHGSCVEITDFAPRYREHGRLYHPTTLMRQVRPLVGNPRLRMLLRPLRNYGKAAPERTRGSNHVRFLLDDITLRLTSNLAVPFVDRCLPFVLEQPLYLVLGPDETVARNVSLFVREALECTVDYWCEWVRYLSVPFEWQDAVIRAAITLKLCQSEATGAIVAALTTSIPEAADSGRNWDYRYCWLRDAAFVVRALNRLGATRSMEEYIRYAFNLAINEDEEIGPVFGIAYERELPEREVDSLAGYHGMGPVRVGNDAWRQRQNDVYGSVVLASAQLFFDHRLHTPGNVDTFRRLESLGARAARLADQPDAGLWEFRGRQAVHTYSAAMCWAACDRLAHIAAHLGLEDRQSYWNSEAGRLRALIEQRAWSERHGHYTDTFDGEHLDASLLLLSDIGFVKGSDPRFVATVDAIGQKLRRGKYIFRYGTHDDFGLPENAFGICTFWYIEALAACNRGDEARELFENMLEQRNALGLLSEDIAPESGELWGNYPQTYSLVGLIQAAMRLSRRWEDAL
ncbi:MAG TPA: glycoside hydrolase family 15 protein [Rhodanobacteraceae bacterium]|nr:glycoside hydrolase family 15 protein [Rhodanobacteraceae bacterium]